MDRGVYGDKCTLWAGGIHAYRELLLDRLWVLEQKGDFVASPHRIVGADGGNHCTSHYRDDPSSDNACAVGDSTQHPLPVQGNVHIYSGKVNSEHSGRSDHEPKSIVGSFRVEITTKGPSSYNRTSYTSRNQGQEHDPSVDTMENHLPAANGGDKLETGKRPTNDAHIDMHDDVRLVQRLPIPVPFTWDGLRFHIGWGQHKEPTKAEPKQGSTKKDEESQAEPLFEAELG